MTPEQLAMIRALRMYSDREGMPLQDRLPQGLDEIPSVRTEPRVKHAVKKYKKNDKGEWIEELVEDMPMRKGLQWL